MLGRVSGVLEEVMMDLVEGLVGSGRGRRGRMVCDASEGPGGGGLDWTSGKVEEVVAHA